MPIDHTSLPVRDLAASRAFYTEILKPLTYSVFMEFGSAVGFAPKGGRSDFWLSGPKDGKQNVEEGNLAISHIAFAGNSKAQVDEFHASAL